MQLDLVYFMFNKKAKKKKKKTEFIELDFDMI